MFKLSDYQYHLLDGYIAQTPAVPADHSKLLVASWDVFHDYHFYDLPKLLTKKEVLFFNDTKVIKARVPLHDVYVEIPHHQTASRNIQAWEIFFLELHDAYRFEGLITLTKRVKKWSIIHYSKHITFTVEDLTDKGVLFCIHGIDAISFFDKYGQMPLPPYITYEDQKESHYQTTFAKELWSVAAPTASLHFTQNVLDEIHEKNIHTHFITLHIWLGTFKPVDTEDIRDYHIHEETIVIDENVFEMVAQEKESGKNIVAVGTTVARTLETLPYLYKLGAIDHSEKALIYWEAIAKDITPAAADKCILSRHKEGTTIICKTRIFIYPWFEWKIVDGLITNFHLPWSTLLMLVASFVGYENIMKMYAYAMDHYYRFFSFGDAMFLRREHIWQS